jgi:hypothetical protein
MFVKTHNFTTPALSHFRDLQRISFGILEETAANLVGGETEKEVDAISLSWFRLKDRFAMSGLGRRSPLWNTLKTSDHEPHDGLWLVEPHAGHA